MRSLAIDIGSTFNSPFGRTIGAGGLVSIIVSNLLVLAGIVMVFFMVAGGIGVIAGSSQDNPEQTAKGKHAVTFAIIGFVVIFASYWIIQIIEQFTGVNIFNPGF
jgi:uncharacterized RDD family membrane protein YckC